MSDIDETVIARKIADALVRDCFHEEEVLIKEENTLGNEVRVYGGSVYFCRNGMSINITKLVHMVIDTTIDSDATKEGLSQ